MTVFGSYLVRVGSLCVIATVAELLLPSGRLKKTARVVFSLVVVLALVTPLTESFSINVDNLKTGDVETLFDEDLMQKICEMRFSELETEIEKRLSAEGIEGATVTVEGETDGKNYVVKKVFVNLKNSVIREEAKHINITVKTLETVIGTVNINKEDVVINE